MEAGQVEGEKGVQALIDNLGGMRVGSKAIIGRAGGAEAGQVEGEKSVLEALQDLGNHFGDRANISAAADAVDEAVAETAAPDEGAPDPPRQRIGKVTASRNFLPC